MKVKTLEKRFNHSPYNLQYVSTSVNCGVKIYAIRSDGSEFTTGIIQKATNERDGISRVWLFPFISFEEMMFLIGCKRSGKEYTHPMQLFLDDNPSLRSSYSDITTSYEAHKKRTDKIVQQRLKEMSLHKRKARSMGYYSDYLELAKKI